MNASKKLILDCKLNIKMWYVFGCVLILLSAKLMQKNEVMNISF